MRRVLLPLLVLSLAPFAPASAGCDPETGECHPVDCLAWQPRPPSKGDVANAVATGDPAYLLNPLLPPVCPT